VEEDKDLQSKQSLEQLLAKQKIVLEEDVRGGRCPLPMLRAKRALAKVSTDDLILVISTDPSAHDDFVAMLKHTQHELMHASEAAYIYRSEGKADHYLYLSKPISSVEDVLPKKLLSLLGELTMAMEIKIDNSTKLVAADAKRVVSELAEKGYYLQVPPTGYIHPCDQEAFIDMNQKTGLPN